MSSHLYCDGCTIEELRRLAKRRGILIKSEFTKEDIVKKIQEFDEYKKPKPSFQEWVEKRKALSKD